MKNKKLFKFNSGTLGKSFFKPLLAPFLACLLTFSFFLPYLGRGKVPIPADVIPGVFYPWRDNSIGGYNPSKFPVKNPLITDPVIATYPWRFITIKNIKQGSWPLWNSYSFSGQPLLGNFESAPFQILNILFFILPFKIAWTVQIILPEILTTFFMYLFLKSIKISTVSSVFASFVLPFTGFFVAWMSMGIIVTTAMWLPLILFCLQKLSQKTSVVYFLILTFAFFQTIFSGHTQTVYSVFMASILFMAFLFKYSTTRKNLIICLLSLILAIIIALPQILPSIEFINLSARNIDQAYNLGRSWFLKPQNLIQILAPDFFGNPSTYNYWGASNYAEFVSFIGLVPLSFVLISFKKNLKHKEVYFFAGLALLSLIFALPNFLSKIPYIYHWPYISSAQPSRIIFLLIFSLVVLCAYGLDQFLTYKSKKIIFPPLLILASLFMLFVITKTFKSEFPNDAAHIAYRNLIFPIVTAIAVLGIYVARLLGVNRKIVIIAIFTLTAVELFRFTAKFTSFSKLSWIFPETEVTNFLSNQPKPFRVMTTNGLILHPNTSSIYGIETINGYDPLYFINYAKLISVSETQNSKAQISSFNRVITPQNYDSRIINLLNAKYVLSFDEINNDNLVEVFKEGSTRIYENKNALPRFFFVNEIQKLENRNQELEKILDSKLDIAHTAVSSQISFKKEDILARVVINKYTDQSIDLTSTTNKVAPLVIANINYPGWIAKIDGKKTQINTVDFGMQSIFVPVGTHHINFKFSPRSFYYGLYIGVFGFIVALLSAIVIWRRLKYIKNQFRNTKV